MECVKYNIMQKKKKVIPSKPKWEDHGFRVVVRMPFLYAYHEYLLYFG